MRDSPGEEPLPDAEFLDEIHTKVFLLPCYSQSPLQLCLEFSTPSNSRNLLHIFFQTNATSYALLLYTAQEKRGQPDRILKIMPRNLNEIILH